MGSNVPTAIPEGLKGRRTKILGSPGNMEEGRDVKDSLENDCGIQYILGEVIWPFVGTVSSSEMKTVKIMFLGLR